MHRLLQGEVGSGKTIVALRAMLTVIDNGGQAALLAPTEVFSASNRPLHGRKGSIFEVIVTDGKAKLSLTFFNQAWREKDLRVGRQGLFAGKVGVFKGKRQLAHPDYELIPDGNDVESAVDEFAGKFLAVYPAASKMPSWKIAQCIDLAIEGLDEVPDFLPDEIRSEHGYPTLHQALVQLHKPADLDHAEIARERLTFDEAFLLQLLLAKRKAALRSLDAIARPRVTGGLLDDHIRCIDYYKVKWDPERQSLHCAQC